MPLDQHILMRTKLVDLFDSSGLTAANRVNPELVELAQDAAARTMAVAAAPRRRPLPLARRPSGRSADGPPGGRAPAREQEPAARDLLHLQPRRLRLGGHRRCCAPACGSRRTQERDEIRAIVEERCRTLLDEDLARARLLGVARRASSAASPRTTPACCPPSRRSSRSSSRRSSSRSSSPPRRSRSASTCPPAPSCSRSSRSSTARRAFRSRRGSTPSSPGAPGAAASTSRATRVIQWVDGLDPQAVASLASRRTYPLNSSFKPTYNMAVNLIEQFGRERTREILESSFAQFQADRAVVDLARKVRSQEESLEGYEKSMTVPPRRLPRVREHPPRAQRPRAQGRGARRAGQPLPSATSGSASSPTCDGG